MNEEMILRGAAEVLQQGEALLQALDAEAYTAPVPAAFDASVGGHYRHCLDHFQSVLDGLLATEVNYDRRRRDPRVESDRDLALGETNRIALGVVSMAPAWLERPVLVRSKVSYYDEGSPAIASTLGRELMYAAAHAIHHYALIGVICRIQGAPLPAGFGVAPSTLQHRAAHRAAS